MGSQLNESDRARLTAAVADMSETEGRRDDQPRERWASHRAASMLAATGATRDDHIAWGWKEPNSHVMIEHIAREFPTARYIHVIRHGLDMAYSSNRQQISNWGPLFGFETQTDDACPPSDVFRYWVAANSRAIEFGRKHLRDRFSVVDLDHLCQDPRLVVRDLFRFAGLSLDGSVVDRAAGLAIQPRTSGRHADHALAWLTDADLQALQRFGYERRLPAE